MSCTIFLSPPDSNPFPILPGSLPDDFLTRLELPDLYAGVGSYRTVLSMDRERCPNPRQMSFMGFIPLAPASSGPRCRAR
jgi:hypothetical protein